MPDGADHGDNPTEPFSEYGELDEKYREPEESSLSPDVPEAPKAPEPTGGDVDPVVEGAFWTLVVVFNVGLIAASVGVMLVVFQARYALGGQVTAAGVLILGYGLYRYRSTKALVEERVGDQEAEDNATDKPDNQDDPNEGNHNE